MRCRTACVKAAAEGKRLREGPSVSTWELFIWIVAPAWHWVRFRTSWQSAGPFHRRAFFSSKRGRGKRCASGTRSRTTPTPRMIISILARRATSVKRGTAARQGLKMIAEGKRLTKLVRWNYHISSEPPGASCHVFSSTTRDTAAHKGPTPTELEPRYGPPQFA